MAYQICICKAQPNYLKTPTLCTTIPQNMRVLDIYGCTPDLLQGEFNDMCIQGVYMPVGCCCAWAVPQNVYSITVEMWGAGGGGGAGASVACCGQAYGGGGGTYVKRSMGVCPGDLITLCAGAGGLMGQSGGGSCCASFSAFTGAPGCMNNYMYCCCGLTGNCSFLLRNGVMCMDAWGGNSGASDCGFQCGTFCVGNGSFYNTSGRNDDGASFACTTSMTVDNKFSPMPTYIPGCQNGSQYSQVSLSSGAAFGGDRVVSGASVICSNYLRWNPLCKNSAGVYGPGGDSCSGSSAYNVGNNYCLSSNSSYTSCERYSPSVPGYFPGGGGGGGSSTVCCMRKTSGGSGASGYIRVFY